MATLYRQTASWNGVVRAFCVESNRSHDWRRRFETSARSIRRTTVDASFHLQSLLVRGDEVIQ